jgi:copper chaperone CopZ
MSSAAFAIAGMSCGHCLNRVNNALQKVDGITAQQVQIGSARVEYDPGRVSAEQIAGAISAAGYRADLMPAS